MLDPQYSYVFLDFETTGLSHERDDIIQVGLIITNANLEIQSYFSSYVNPGYEIEKLKTIVAYTTGITPEQIIGGMNLDEFRAKMLELIPNDAVFIGQNINFDIRFLKKYLGNSQFSILNSQGGGNGNGELHNGELRIDTLDRAKALIHYPASYSLDVLYPLIRDQLGSDYFKLLAQNVGLVDIINHDALSDCLICIAMMEYFKQKIIGICSSFPIAKTIIAKSRLPFIDSGSINLATSEPSNIATSKVPLLDFPEKPLASKILDTSYERGALRNGERLYYGNLAIEQLIRKATGLTQVIICTNSRNKLSIIKAKCKAMGLYDISFIKEQQQVSKEKLNIIYSKEKLESFEGWFFLKYCSHKLQGLGLLDLNSVGDYKVYNFIRDDSDNSKSNIILATHPALFASIDAGEYADYKILFLDQERWYNSYLKYISLPRDPINFARVLDNFVYEDELLTGATSSLRELMNLVDIFCGVLFMEIRDYIKERKPNKQEHFEIGVISGKLGFEKTNALYQKLTLTKSTLLLNLPSDNTLTQVIIKQFEKLEYYMENIVNISIYASDYISYQFHHADKFVEYNEFNYQFRGREHFFLSNTNETWIHIGSEDAVNKNNQNTFFEIKDIEDITKISLHQKVFILNNNPTKAKKIFEYMMKDANAGGRKILVENVTGGRGKCVELAKKAEDIILVGGYEMLLQCIQDKLPITQVIVCGELGLLHKQIIGDLKYWMR